MATGVQVPRRRSKGGKPPYDLFRDALRAAEERYPGAEKYKPCWHSGRIFVEIWQADGHADICEYVNYEI